MLNVLGKCFKPMLTCKFHLIFYFYLLKPFNFNDSNLLLSINNSVGNKTFPDRQIELQSY